MAGMQRCFFFEFFEKKNQTADRLGENGLWGVEKKVANLLELAKSIVG
jgi:hypothetical protein